jgi:hypothetical protein
MVIFSSYSDELIFTDLTLPRLSVKILKSRMLSVILGASPLCGDRALQGFRYRSIPSEAGNARNLRLRSRPYNPLRIRICRVKVEEPVKPGGQHKKFRRAGVKRKGKLVNEEI